VHFERLPHYTTNAWQGGDKLPDPTIGWAVLNAAGGHPGDATHAVIRRWTAPAAGTLRIDGLLAHPAEQGDGVRGRIISSRAGVLGSWDVHHGEAVTNIPSLAVQAGDTVDFVTDSRANVDYDTFIWAVTARLKTNDKAPEQVWESPSGFHGPLNPPLTRWQ